MQILTCFETLVDHCGHDEPDQKSPAPKETRSRDTERHYHFVIHGCDSNTYAVIPQSENPLYYSILAETSTMDDFPRQNLGDNMRLARSQNSCLYVDQL